MRGRVAAGQFESEMLASTTGHIVASFEAPAFRACCRWRAYAAVLEERKNDAVAGQFTAEFGRQLLRPGGVLGALPPSERWPSTPRPEYAEVLVELWCEGKAEGLVLPIVVEGDPWVDAQLILSEEFAAPISPDPVLCAIESWLLFNGTSVEGEGGGGVAVDVQHFYVNTRGRRRSELKNMTAAYVPKQRVIQVNLRRSADESLGPPS